MWNYLKRRSSFNQPSPACCNNAGRAGHRAPACLGAERPPWADWNAASTKITNIGNISSLYQLDTPTWCEKFSPTLCSQQRKHTYLFILVRSPLNVTIIFWFCLVAVTDLPEFTLRECAHHICCKQWTPSVSTLSYQPYSTGGFTFAHKLRCELFSRSQISFGCSP